MTTLYGQFDAMIDAVLSPSPRGREVSRLKCIDLFCGIGGFHVAAKNMGLDVVFASDIDEAARAAYRYNYGMTPAGDIVSIQAEDIPDHDILFAGFPCQPFSIIGSKRGTDDPRGTLFLEILRIVRVKKPLGIVMENVKQLATAQHGAVLRQILGDLQGMGYSVDWRILNALDFGLPQKRERVIIVATLQTFGKFPWPTEKAQMIQLADILEKNPDPKHFVSERIRAKRHAAHKAQISPSIWHENKAGHISSYPWSCALRAGASYNYLLVNGERRLTPREMLRLQGFPDSFKITCNDSQTRKQAGNAVPVPLVEAAIKGVLNVLGRSKIARECQPAHRAIPARAIARQTSI
ncbi:MAG: DNA (cytosine-5-)-methyltransferase [Armatimonadota bacterium]|nr:DNA (cytosine-5-)-methyltransferase [Armatimonadota bacterium]